MLAIGNYTDFFCLSAYMNIVSTPDLMAPLLGAKQIENIFFKKHLRQHSTGSVDDKIHRLYKEVSNQIDCLACANCCKKLEPGLEGDDEIERLAVAVKQEVDDFKRQFIAFDGDALYLKTKPCMFLKDCACSIYEHRPSACAGYPHLDQQDMKYRKTLWENYGVCPIVFMVIEQLKLETGFQYPPQT
jgi:Fe-S-cluster containining protein